MLLISRDQLSYLRYYLPLHFNNEEKKKSDRWSQLSWGFHFHIKKKEVSCVLSLYFSVCEEIEKKEHITQHEQEAERK